MTLLLTALVFSPSFSNAFLNFDDPANITHNDAIRAINGQTLKTYFTTPLIGMYSPLVYLSYAIDFRIGGLDVTVYHATNLLLHLLSVGLVWFIVRSLTGQFATTIVATALFAVHPVQVAAVVPLSIRSSLLYASFYLAAYLAYLSYIRTRSRLRFGLSFGLFLLSALSKSAAVVFPFLLILTDHYYRRVNVRTLVIEKAPFLAASLVFGIVGLSVRNDITMMGGLLHYSIFERVCLAAYGLVFYGFTLAAPFALSAFYTYPARVAGYLPLAVYLAPVALLAITWMATRVGTDRRLLAFGGLFFAIHIVLVLKVVPLGLEFAADRYLYVPSIGLFIVAAELCRRAPVRIRKAGLVCLGAAVALCSIASYGRSADWKDNLTFYTRILERDPGNAAAHNNIGRVLAAEGQAGEAIPHFVEAIRAALAGQGRLQEATTQYRAALALNPDSPEAHNNLGAALADQGRAAEAIEQFSAALRANAGFVDARRNLGLAFAGQGRDDDAIREFREVLRLDPRLGDVHFNLAVLLADRGDRAEAVEHLELALKLQPADQAARRLLAALTKQRRK